MPHHPDITVVLCTYNRAAMLREALQSLAELQLPDSLAAEVLVVDNASTDETPQVVREVASRSAIPVRSVREPRQGVVHARIRGVSAARGEWIAFFDDDQLADPHWLAELHRLAVRKGALCVGGAVWLKLPQGVRRNLSPVCRMLLGETVDRHRERKYDHRFTPGTGNLMLHRSLFEKVGTFDAAFHERGEDTDLFLRILAAGFDAWYTPAAIVRHVIPYRRLEDDFLLRLARIMAENMAANERSACGARRYPAVWTARVLQLAGVLFPRWLWGVIRRDRERRLGARCRMAIAVRGIKDGWRLMFPRSRHSSPASASRRSAWVSRPRRPFDRRSHRRLWRPAVGRVPWSGDRGTTHHRPVHSSSINRDQ